MPNIKSAKRRMRSDEVKQTRNRGIKSSLKTAERRLDDAIKDGNKENTTAALKAVHSSYDRAAKQGVVHASKANRKKSRLAARANAVA
ncbi:MAG: 30S ribosomal protein S20 [Verrucomicrobiota bacterium]|jgi:small subunit ribosomal protein S20|nr:30S ribosomal protein S20 [Verrucomicrobiota bacterium]MED5453469.1 30S ribosomal protein S20 [Verrucomicrobiota bacterium]|tara:strand:+ start:1072 stop:1335 length:264 start_codon:yes stop_codon:yes gene_type:complete